MMGYSYRQTTKAMMRAYANRGIMFVESLDSIRRHCMHLPRCIRRGARGACRGYVLANEPFPRLEEGSSANARTTAQHEFFRALREYKLPDGFPRPTRSHIETR